MAPFHPMKRLLCLLLLSSVALCANAAIPTKEFPLWPDGAPGARGSESHDIPTLTPLWPSKKNATGAAMIICPGGGYGGLMMGYEGEHFAKWLNEHGIAGFVLKYRLGSKGYRHPIMKNDAQRAIRYVRFHAKEWKLDPNKIGILGASAGGHLAATTTVHFDFGDTKSNDPIDLASSRPDVGILCYPVISMGEFTHKGSRKNLLGDHPSKELKEELSCELQVKPDSPPCFIFHTVADQAVPVENALLFASALRENNVPFDLHIYQEGNHGVALGSKDYDPKKWHPWTKDCIFWLKRQGFAK